MDGSDTAGSIERLAVNVIIHRESHSAQAGAVGERIRSKVSQRIRDREFFQTVTFFKGTAANIGYTLWNGQLSQTVTSVKGMVANSG